MEEDKERDIAKWAKNNYPVPAWEKYFSLKDRECWWKIWARARMIPLAVSSFPNTRSSWSNGLFLCSRGPMIRQPPCDLRSCAWLLHPNIKNQGKGMSEVPWLAVELREWFASSRSTFHWLSLLHQIYFSFFILCLYLFLTFIFILLLPSLFSNFQSFVFLFIL